MNELNISIENVPKKLESYQKMVKMKQMKFVTNETKIFLIQFYQFHETKPKISVDSFYFSCYPFRKPPQ